MDFSSILMDQDHIGAPSDKWTDHVKWQGSQTACPALNQLIKSSVNETVQEKAPRMSGWQRVSSYDQLPSPRSTGHRDAPSNLTSFSSHTRTSSSKPSSSSRPHSRARLSEAREPAPDLTLPIPLFNKTNPMQFLDIMKGVSARLDENAGVRPRKELNPGCSSSSSRVEKRMRGVSLGGTSELQAEKATCGTVKKGRFDELRTSDTLTLTFDEGKGNGRAMAEDESLNLEVRGRGLQAHSSLPDIPARSDIKRSLSSKDMSFMDVDNKDDDMDVEHASCLNAPSCSDHGYPDTRPFVRTRSQIEMPPPSISDSVFKQHPSAADPSRQQSNAPSISTPLAVSRQSNSINKPQTSYPPSQKPTYSVKQRKPDAIPKLHPLLYHKPGATRVSSSSIATPIPQVQSGHYPVPIAVSTGPDLKPPPSSFMPMFSSTPCSRPPALGMRRNHTFPSRTSSSSSSTVQQESASSLISSSGSQLPQRQKGFKPPLLTLSQPQVQTQTQMRGLSQPAANTNAIVVGSGSTTVISSKISSSRNLPEALTTNNHGPSTTTNTSMDLQSSSSISDSSDLFRSTPSTSASSPCSHFSNSSRKSSQGKTQHVQQPQESESAIIPEPLDGDADSSFGDMSLDMDALEEIMKMYD